MSALPEKALRAFANVHGVVVGRGSTLERGLAAFQTALYDELREQVAALPCEANPEHAQRADCLVRRGAVLALLAPKPEPRYKPGDVVVYENGDIAVVYADDGDDDYVFAARTGFARPQVGVGLLRSRLRPATPAEIAAARGEHL